MKFQIVPILYHEPAFEAFDDFSDFLESISCETSKTCQVRGSNPCQTDQDRLCVDQAVHRGFACGRTCLRERLVSPTSRRPTRLPTHFPFLVDCPTGDSLHTWRCLAQMYGGMTFGQRQYTTLLPAQTR